jgi:hypothetical protein
MSRGTQEYDNKLEIQQLLEINLKIGTLRNKIVPRGLSRKSILIMLKDSKLKLSKKVNTFSLKSEGFFLGSITNKFININILFSLVI